MSKHQQLREAIGLEMGRLRLAPGDILVMRPVTPDIAFTDTFVRWLADEVGRLLPPGCSSVVIPEHVVSFEIPEPQIGPEIREEIALPYRAGWRNAFKYIKRSAPKGTELVLRDCTVPVEVSEDEGQQTTVGPDEVPGFAEVRRSLPAPG